MIPILQLGSKELYDCVHYENKDCGAMETNSKNTRRL